MKQKRSHVGCLFWVALVLLVIVVFLFNRPKINQVLKSTGLTNLVMNQSEKPTPPQVTRKPALPEKKPSPAPTTSEPTAAPGRSGQSTETNAPVPSTGTSNGNQKSPPQSSPSKTPVAQKQPSRHAITQRFHLYFVKIDSDGNPVLISVSTPIDFVDSPLTKTFDSLLSGVTQTDRTDGLRSLIPEGTRLLSAAVRNGTAYLDFNDRFRFNSYGVQGYNAQLEQVVYTATQFQTVERVQILLDGKVRKFLAPEGIPIDKPLDRSSFSG